jgi:hypothetical protein
MMSRNTTIVLICHHHKLPTNPRMVKKFCKTVKNLYKSIPRRTAAVMRAKVAQHHTDKGMSTVSAVFSLFCPTLVYHSILMGTSVQMITIGHIKASSYTAVGIRHADHVAPSIQKSWHFLHR